MKYISMLVLAKSYKSGERCIAGKQVTSTEGKNISLGDWVRPVTNINGGEGKGAIPRNVYFLSNKQEAKVLDIVRIPIIGRVSVPGQPENILIDEKRCWDYESSLSPSNVNYITDDVNDIWDDPKAPSNIVTRAYDEKGLIGQSLMLVKPVNFVLTLSSDYDDFNRYYRRRITASFQYKGKQYENFAITDPAILKMLKNKYPADGGTHVRMKLLKGDNYSLCLSLTPRFGSKELHYKLIASVFDYDGYLQQRYAA
jgi:hypothetical protein